METNPEFEARIAEMEKVLAAANARAQKYSGELEKLRQQYADDLFAERQSNKRLQDECHHLQLDYEQLRVQKGGFGLKMLLFTGFSGFVGSLFMFGLYLLFRPDDNHTAAFEQFRDRRLFNYELAISEGRFREVEYDLQVSLDHPENRLIRPEIDFTKKIVGAARRRCEEK